MKKLIFISLVAICGVGMTNIARGATCAALGLSGSCHGNGSGNDGFVITNSKCTSTSSNCKYVTCNGSCHCNVNGACSTVIDPGEPVKKGCSGTPTWGATALYSGEITGTCKTSSGDTITVYGCKDGYYTTDTCTLNSFSITTSDSYSTSSVSCTECPHHPDYVRPSGVFEIGAPSYVTTDGVGCKKQNKCKIKANSGISGATGTFVFETACSYAS